MSTIYDFRNILVWQKSHLLALNIYKITEQYPHSELFGLVSQIRRSAISVPANIAEGFARRGIKESLRFYNISEASLSETKYFIILSKDLGYIDENTYEQLIKKSNEIGKMLNGWIDGHQRKH